MSLLGRKIRVVRKMPGLNVRFSEESDGAYWAKWLKDPDVKRWYPMNNDEERKESVARMVSFCKYKCALTAEFEEKIVGIAYLNLHPYRKIAHHCLFTVVIDPEARGKGIGTVLMEHLERLARDSFRIKILHLEMYERNPAIRLYLRLGYREFGSQSHWSKEGPGRYSGKIYMEKRLSW